MGSGRIKQARFSKYTGNSEYVTLTKPVYIINERIFFEIPVFQFIEPNDLGYYHFSYKIEVLNPAKASIYTYKESPAQMKLEEFPDKDYLRFFYDTNMKTKPGKYLLKVTILDLNTGYTNEWKEDFEMVKK
jgi:hypothetical protein